jgi:hypothetical protein
VLGAGVEVGAVVAAEGRIDDTLVAGFRACHRLPIDTGHEHVIAATNGNLSPALAAIFGVIGKVDAGEMAFGQARSVAGATAVAANAAQSAFDPAPPAVEMVGFQVGAYSVTDVGAIRANAPAMTANLTEPEAIGIAAASLRGRRCLTPRPGERRSDSGGDRSQETSAVARRAQPPRDLVEAQPVHLTLWSAHGVSIVDTDDVSPHANQYNDILRYVFPRTGSQTQ